MGNSNNSDEQEIIAFIGEDGNIVTIIGGKIISPNYERAVEVDKKEGRDESTDRESNPESIENQ